MKLIKAVEPQQDKQENKMRQTQDSFLEGIRVKSKNIIDAIEKALE